MSINLDTQTIRRLRDALVENGRIDDNDHSGGDIAARSQASLARVAPFVETMYLMMMVDGEAADAERDALRGAVNMLTHGLLQAGDLDDVLQRCEEEARKQGVEHRLQTIGARLCADRLDRETAFSLAAAVALADNQVVEAESLLVESIAEWYGVSSKRCAAILDEVGGA